MEDVALFGEMLVAWIEGMRKNMSEECVYVFWLGQLNGRW